MKTNTTTHGQAFLPPLKKREPRYHHQPEALESRIAPAFAAVVELGALMGGDGFKISGVAAGDYSGRSVSGAGDINGDGFDDLIVGARSASPNGSGASYVVFGSSTPFTANLNLSTLNGTNGFKISGEARYDDSGVSVSGAGDINGDGIDDLIVGGVDFRASYVVFGRRTPFAANVNLSTLNGTDGFNLSGEARYDDSGVSVSGAGDINGDGIDDLIVGAPGANTADRDYPQSGVHPSTYYGASYVVFGRSTPFAANVNLGTLNGTNGFKISGEGVEDRLGRSVSGAGDINGDGIDDLIVGAPYAGNINTGASYVIFGSRTPFAEYIELSRLTGINGFKLKGATGDFSGISVSGAGDINGDGIDDIIVGAPYADANGSRSGASYVVFGSSAGFAANVNLSGLTGANGFKLSGATGFDTFGKSVSSAGDINGDGIDDLIVGAHHADSNGFSGASYVVFGSSKPFTANVNLSGLTGANGFKLSGNKTGDRVGYSVSGAGDINGDGIDDLIIGAPYAGNSESGASYVVFGSGQATISPDGKIATYLDVDGDTVTIKSSKGGLSAGRLQLSAPNAIGGAHLISADFTDPFFAGANITINAKAPKARAVVSDGLANVGSIFAGANALGSVKLDGDLGQIDAGAVKSLTVYSLGLFPVGTTGGANTSELASLGALSVKTSWQSVDVAVTGALGSVNIGGSVSGATLSAATVGEVKIVGDVLDAEVLIEGVPTPSAKQAVAFKSLSVGGDLSGTSILLGYNATAAPVSAQVQVGKVAVKGNWIASNLIVGTTAGTDELFGTADDAVIGGTSTVVSRIASITIGGQALGTTDAGDHFGIVARQIGALKVGKAKVALDKSGKDVFEFLLTGDFIAREV